MNTLPEALDSLSAFHPVVQGWFRRAFAAPTPAQQAAWPSIRAGRSSLVAAPTGSGKTLTAFLAALDDLLRQGLAGELTDATQVVYVSPLKALSNDIHLNLDVPLAGIAEELVRQGLPPVEIHTAVRTGDTPHGERAAMRKRAPHIPGDHARVAVRAAGFGLRARNAGQYPQRYRRRNSRSGRQ